MSFWRKLGRGFKAVGKGAASVAPLSIPLAAATVSPLLGEVARQILAAAEAGGGEERLQRLRQAVARVAPAIGVDIAGVAGRPVRNPEELEKALEHHVLFIHHLEKAYGEAEKSA